MIPQNPIAVAIVGFIMLIGYLSFVGAMTLWREWRKK